MFMFNGCLTSLTEVKIRTNSTFVSNTNDSFLSTTITVNSLMNHHSWLLSCLWLLVQGLLSYDWLIVHFFFHGNSWFLFNLFWNLRFDLGDDLRHHFSEFILNHWILKLWIVKGLILNFDLWYFFLNMFDFLNLLNHWFMILLNLYFIGDFHKFFTVLSDGDFHSLKSRVEENLVITLIFECNFVTIWIEVA